MHSYVKIHHFEPKTDYRPIEDLLPLIEKALWDQKASSKLDPEELSLLRHDIIESMRIYYRLVGIDDEVIKSDGTDLPSGILPRYCESLIEYFQSLQQQKSTNKEIAILEYSGVTTIKVRYKYTESVIKKLVKIGLRDHALLKDPLKIFLKGGALHDLVGILFVCSYPYEKEWVARSLYNFFEYPHRTDDHLQYGFYTVAKESGYRALHCDHTLFNPRFDPEVSRPNEAASGDPDVIFSLLDERDSPRDVLRKLKDYFNIEIQLHTAFENLWASMEHTNNYNIQAKGTGRSKEITVQWKILAQMMDQLQLQFQKLQIDTEQAQYKESQLSEYILVGELFEELGSDALEYFITFRKKLKDLESLLNNHEISRDAYVRKMRLETESIDAFALRASDPAIKTIFKMQGAFVYFSLAEHHHFFNDEDIQKFIQIAKERYSKIHHFLQNHPTIYKARLLNIIAILRSMQLEQKFGLGLIKTDAPQIDDLTLAHGRYKHLLELFGSGITILNTLSSEDLLYLKEDNVAYLEIIQYYDIFTRDWELSLYPKEEPQREKITQMIALFRDRFMTQRLLEQFERLLGANQMKHIGFVVKFYTTLVWHGIVPPLYSLRQIIKYSAYDKIKASDLFYYELSAYRFLVLRGCETLEDCQKEAGELERNEEKISHYENYHKENMIQLLFRISSNEPEYRFHKARIHFEKMTGTPFKMNYFSDTLEP